MRGPDFAGKQRVFYFFIFFFHLPHPVVLGDGLFVLNKPPANLFVIFLDSAHIEETPSDSNIQDSLH